MRAAICLVTGLHCLSSWEVIRSGLMTSATIFSVMTPGGQGVEKLIVSKMLVEGSNRRIHAVDRHAGLVNNFLSLLPCVFII